MSLFIGSSFQVDVQRVKWDDVCVFMSVCIVLVTKCYKWTQYTEKLLDNTATARHGPYATCKIEQMSTDLNSHSSFCSTNH